MKLQDIAEVLEYAKVKVMEGDECVASYDRRNSIPEEYNDREIISLIAVDNAVYVFI